MHAIHNPTSVGKNVRSYSSIKQRKTQNKTQAKRKKKTNGNKRKPKQTNEQTKRNKLNIKIKTNSS